MQLIATYCEPESKEYWFAFDNTDVCISLRLKDVYQHVNDVHDLPKWIKDGDVHRTPRRTNGTI